MIFTDVWVMNRTIFCVHEHKIFWITIILVWVISWVTALHVWHQQYCSGLHVYEHIVNNKVDGRWCHDTPHSVRGKKMIMLSKEMITIMGAYFWCCDLLTKPHKNATPSLERAWILACSFNSFGLENDVMKSSIIIHYWPLQKGLLWRMNYSC